MLAGEHPLAHGLDAALARQALQELDGLAGDEVAGEVEQQPFGLDREAGVALRIALEQGAQVLLADVFPLVFLERLPGLEPLRPVPCFARHAPSSM